MEDNESMRISAVSHPNLLERVMGFEPTTSCLGSFLETSWHSLARPTACLLSAAILANRGRRNQALLNCQPSDAISEG
jgi:hypothetical protein